MEIELVEFFNGELSDVDRDVKMSFKEVKSYHLKGGLNLIVEGIEGKWVLLTYAIHAQVNEVLYRLSLVSSTARSVSDSDIVWEDFPPSDYQEILSRLVWKVVYSSKKLTCFSEVFIRIINK
ncbi:hypothetical protein QYF36_014380 [Acer negundo]|nr:hypothetical protein QYF36_014380 [Acer negundo]